ncbi:HTH domain-containing protein [Enterococcus sp. CSURQ0835]|uniref:HTH domain-containing protein n=1 Tax=Enterococcus sp. CSURQ0835 TaxID=2681394 RepID=UPI001358BFEF|nr:helix-turn-helix domain-containing protein [Enterococcus sp. CSURQ0835]
MRPLTTIESDVLDVIPMSKERTISIREISQLIGVDERTIYKVVNSLRENGVPVCALRAGENRGYFIATTEQEREEGVRAYKAQVKEMNAQIDWIEGADLADWPKQLKRVGEVQ